MKEKNNPVEPELEALIKEVADEMGIPTGIGREAYLHLMESGIKQMRNFVPFVLPNMGLFYMSTRKTQKLIERMIKSYRSRIKYGSDEGMTMEQLKERLPMYWELHNIAKSHYPKTGKRYKREQRKKMYTPEQRKAWIAEQKLKRKEKENNGRTSG